MISATAANGPGIGVLSIAALLPMAGTLCHTGLALATRRVDHYEDICTSLIHAALFGTLITSARMPFVWQPGALADLRGGAC